MGFLNLLLGTVVCFSYLVPAREPAGEGGAGTGAPVAEYVEQQLQAEEDEEDEVKQLKEEKHTTIGCGKKFGLEDAREKVEQNEERCEAAKAVLRLQFSCAPLFLLDPGMFVGEFSNRGIETFCYSCYPLITFQGSCHS